MIQFSSDAHPTRQNPRWAVALPLLVALGAVMTACGDSMPHSRTEVLQAFTASVTSRVVPFDDREAVQAGRVSAGDAQSLVDGWVVAAIARGRVEYIEEQELGGLDVGGFYEVSVPALDRSDTVELWGYDMDLELDWVVNSGALATAIFLFCASGDDLSPDITRECRNYLWDLYRFQQAISGAQ